MQLRVRFYFVVSFLVIGVAYAADEKKEEEKYYPLSWAQIDFKPIVDNERLFKKYKTCLLTDSPAGCPRDVVHLRGTFL